MLVKHFFILPILKIKNGTAKLNCTNNKIPVILTTFFSKFHNFFKIYSKNLSKYSDFYSKNKNLLLLLSNLSIIIIFQLHFF